MYIAIANYGNESTALLQWLAAASLKNVYVLSVDTGWAGDSWQQRVEQGEAFARQQGMQAVRLSSKSTFSELVEQRQSFPNKKFQWCAGFLKGLPILEWLDEHDSACQATIVLATRRTTSRANFDLPEYIDESDYYNGRKVWHPLYAHQSIEQLLQACPLQRLSSQRSLECQPCIHSDSNDINHLSIKDLEKMQQLEKITNQTMFPAQFFAVNVDYPDMGCGSPWGCGT